MLSEWKVNFSSFLSICAAWSLSFASSDATSFSQFFMILDRGITWNHFLKGLYHASSSAGWLLKTIIA